MLPFLACSNVTIGILSVPSAAAYACSIAVCNLDDKTFPYLCSIAYSLCSTSGAEPLSLPVTGTLLPPSFSAIRLSDAFQVPLAVILISPL